MSLMDALMLEEPTPPTTPTAREIFIALRREGARGSGTINDPYDGSTRLADPYHAGTLFDASRSLLDFAMTSGDAREVVATTDGDHGFSDGDLVRLSGDTGNAAAIYNGVFAIYGVTGNTFKVQIAVTRARPVRPAHRRARETPAVR